MTDCIEVARAPKGGGWSIKHNRSFLGHVASRDEALAIATMLADSLVADGRQAELLAAPEARSFVPAAPEARLAPVWAPCAA